MKSKIKKSKGFTLIEILTVVFLGTIIILAAYSVYSMSYLSYKKNTVSSELTQNARIALERMSREMRQSPEIITVLPLDPGAGTPSAEIKFREGHDLFGEDPPDCEYQYVTYQLSSTDLVRVTNHYYLAADPTVCVPYDPDQPSLIPVQDSIVVKAQQITQLQFWGTNNLITTRLKVSDGSTTYEFETRTMARNV